MKRFFTIIALALMAAGVTGQVPTHSRISIDASTQDLERLAARGIDVTEGIVRKGQFITMELSGKEIMQVESLGLKYEVLIPDVSAYYVERNAGKSANAGDYKGMSEWEVPENFTFGSMSGHATFEEAVDHLDNMHTLFPDLITEKQSIGQTVEGRDIWMVKISDNPDTDEEEPEVLYTSLHHAREPAGLMTNLFFMYYLLENYESDPIVQAIVDGTELYFVPVINADGYVYNEENNPNGGGMWRKNRTDNGVPGCEGVDLNRNYDFLWGLDDIGSSSDPCDATYRGTAPFSEPESQAIRDLCLDHAFVNALNYHTYSNLLLYPWGYTEDPCEDDAIFHAHSILYTAESNYTYGPGSTTIYPTNGGSDDWMYGEQETKNKILAYTPELGGGADGFWCSIDRIVPIAQENMIMNMLVAAFAGWYADVSVETFPLVGETEGYISYAVQRLGLDSEGATTVTFEPISGFITSGTVEKTYSDLGMLESLTDSVPYTLDPEIPGGTALQFKITVDQGGILFTDTVNRIYGEVQTAFEDPCDNMSHWISPYWTSTTSAYYSAPGSITDSPNGDYNGGQISPLIFDEEVDLTGANFAMLDFRAKWEIEAGYDYVQLMISDNEGTTWTPLSGLYTVTGTPYQAEGEPVYDGFQTEWVHEQIDLSDWVGNSVTFRFLLKSDNWVEEDGFYLDDFRISVVEEAYVGMDEASIDLWAPMPNPAKDQVVFRYKGNLQPASLSIFNTLGQLQWQQLLEPGSDQITVDLKAWDRGMYIYRLEGIPGQENTGKLILR